ncbi:MAG: helix-turn-helix domain-containing protein [Rickettsiaceae bacterium]|nr:helix-turn-helix domain-containing protein [Rickettsiaceae bacterium]
MFKKRNFYGRQIYYERERIKTKAILEGVKDGRITLTLAAKKLELSYRQTQRVYKRYLEEGNKGLIHKSRGKPPSTSIK